MERGHADPPIESDANAPRDAKGMLMWSPSTLGSGNNSPTAVPSRSSAFEESLHGTDGRPRVLVVDDEFLMRWSVAETLSAEGCAVREAGDGETAMRVMVDSRWPVDVVVLDYCLPDTRDLDLLSQMRRVRPGCQIILMTSDPDPELTRRALALGARSVIGKPFEMSELASLVLGAERLRARRVS